MTLRHCQAPFLIPTAPSKFRHSLSQMVIHYQNVYHLFNGMHPLGVQPLGNAFLNGLSPHRDPGLGDLKYLTDTVLLNVLEYLDARSLANVAASHTVLRCFAYFEDLWKRHVIETWNGNFTFLHCWRCTYASQLGYTPYHGNIPPVTRLYSDLLYQPWHCAQTSLPDEWLDVDTVPRRQSLTLAEFRREYEVPNRPVILTDCMQDWSAQQLWTEEYLKETLSGKLINVGSYLMKLDDYLMYCERQEDDMPLYAFDADVFDRCPELEAAFEIPEVFSEDLFSCLEHRPNYRWLIIGPERSGSTFHKDPNGTSAWNAVIRGSKKWMLFPPSILPPGVHQSPDASEVATSISLIEWFINSYEVHHQECVVHEGEILFIPSGWWHMAMNLEQTMAITQNFVSRVTLPHVLQFLKSGNRDLVSGIPIECRDQLYDAFIQALQRHHPEILEVAIESLRGLKRPALSRLFHPSVTESNKKRQKEQQGASDHSSFKFGFF